MKSNSEFQNLYQSSLLMFWVFFRNFHNFFGFFTAWGYFRKNIQIFDLQQNFPEKLQLQKSAFLEFIQICDNLYNVT